MEMSKKEKAKRSIIIIIIMVIACVSIVSARERRAKVKKEKVKIQNVEVVGNYNVDIIRATSANSNKTNYLISPYNIELALNMLREGADGNTKDELDKVLGNRTINDVSVKDKVGVANAIFIKDAYKNSVKNDFNNIMKNKYNSDIIYDKFNNPDKINNWVKEKTNGMIDKVLDRMNENFVMGLASALAIDVKWSSNFDCENTTSEEFTKENKEKIKVEMMHKSYTSNANYFKTSDAEGIIIPYKKEENSNVELEFVGILPNDSVENYISKLDQDKINDIFDNQQVIGKKLNVDLSLPRFKYDYEVENFIGILNSLGIKDAFNVNAANFKKMIETIENVYVGEAVHKTHIELNETGTKAAAVTYIGMYAKSMITPIDIETINLKFNKPFVYMIREKNTGEILFFGTVYEPNIWKTSTCS